MTNEAGPIEPFAPDVGVAVVSVLPSAPIGAEGAAPQTAADPHDSHRKERARRFRLSIISSILIRPLSVVVPLVSTPLFLTYLGGKEGYGLYESIGALAMWLGMTNAGLGLGLVNKLTDCYVTGNRELARRYMTSLLAAMALLAVVGMILVSVVTPLIDWRSVFGAQHFSRSQLGWAFWVAGLIALAGIVTGTSGAVYTAYQEIHRSNVWDGAAKVVTLLACVAVIFTRWGLIGVILASAGAPTLVRAINFAWQLAVEKPFLRPRWRLFDFPLLKTVLGEGVCLLVLQLSALALFQTDKLIIGFVRGAEDVTEFSLAGRLFFTAYGLFVLLIGPLWPFAGEAIRRGDLPWVRRTLTRSLLLGCGGMLACGAFLLLFGNWVVHVWLRRPDVMLPKLLVAGLTLAFIVRIWTEVQSLILNAAGVLIPQAWVLVSNALLNLIVGVMLARISANAVAWSIPITTLLTSGWIYPILIRRHLSAKRAQIDSPPIVQPVVQAGPTISNSSPTALGGTGHEVGS